MEQKLASEVSLHSRTNGGIFERDRDIYLTDAVAHTVMFYVNSNFVKLQYSVRFMYAPIRSPKRPNINDV